MVSRIVKRRATKSSQYLRNRKTKTPLKKTPVKAVSSVLASINKSIASCKRGLVKIFSKFAKAGNEDYKKTGFKFLKKLNLEDVARVSPFPSKLLPPLTSTNKKTVILDLDETLVHSKVDPAPENYDFIVKPVIDGEILKFYVQKRPGLDEFLREISENSEVVVFTAGLKEYASIVLDQIDPNGVISHRLYRDSCTDIDGKLVKDLSKLSRDLRNVVIIDDNPNAYSLQPQNAIAVSSFVGDLSDLELFRVLNFFKISSFYDDIRDAVKCFKLGENQNLDHIKYDSP